MTLEEKLERALAALAAAMKKSGIKQASGFVPNPPAAKPQNPLDELLDPREVEASQKKGAAKKAAA